MRILICSNTYPPRFVGGAELVAHEQAREFVRQGHHVVVFSGDIDGPGEHYEHSIEDYDNIEVHRVKTTHEDYSPYFFDFLHPAIESHFIDLLENFNPEVVHFHNIIGLSVRLPMLAAERNVKTICTLHDFWGFCLRNTAIRLDGKPCTNISLCHECLPYNDAPGAANIPIRLRKDLIALALDHMDAFIAPSRFIADRYREAGLPEHRLHIIPNGLDTARFVSAGHRRWGHPARLAYVGYFGVHKGVETLLAALTLLREPHKAELNLIGCGPQEPQYRAQVSECGLEDRVCFRGVIPPVQMPRLYAEIDILILPSIWGENQPVCLMEAMASGLPVVASRIGGIPELIEHEANGLLFQAGAAQDLASAIERFLDNPDFALTLANRGRERVTNQTYVRQVCAQTALYLETLDERRDTKPRKQIFAIDGDFLSIPIKKSLMRRAKRGPINSYKIPRQWLTNQIKANTINVSIIKFDTINDIFVKMGAFINYLTRLLCARPPRR